MIRVFGDRVRAHAPAARSVVISLADGGPPLQPANVFIVSARKLRNVWRDARRDASPYDTRPLTPDEANAEPCVLISSAGEEVRAIGVCRRVHRVQRSLP